MTKLEGFLKGQHYAIDQIDEVIKNSHSKAEIGYLRKQRDRLVGVRKFLAKFNELLEHTL